MTSPTYERSPIDIDGDDDAATAALFGDDDVLALPLNSDQLNSNSYGCSDDSIEIVPSDDDDKQVVLLLFFSKQ